METPSNLLNLKKMRIDLPAALLSVLAAAGITFSFSSQVVAQNYNPVDLLGSKVEAEKPPTPPKTPKPKPAPAPGDGRRNFQENNSGQISGVPFVIPS